MAFLKQKRIVNEELLESLRDKPCFICNKIGPSDVHHLTSKGSGGDDVENNLISLCRKHHSEIHQYGLSKFSWKYPRLRELLTRLLRHDLLEKIREK